MTDLRNIFLTALVILCACSTSDVPEDLLSKEKMTKAMIEIHLLEARISKLTIDPRDSAQAVYDHYERLLFKDLEINQDQYERSFNYYVDNANEFQKIYNAVVDSLMAKEKLYRK
ncbi:MAG: DUF4296 domain-containing protein [Ekhidna sp.]